MNSAVIDRCGSKAKGTRPFSMPTSKRVWQPGGAAARRQAEPRRGARAVTGLLRMDRGSAFASSSRDGTVRVWSTIVGE
jgi:hypothetical protein